MVKLTCITAWRDLRAQSQQLGTADSAQGTSGPSGRGRMGDCPAVAQIGVAVL